MPYGGSSSGANLAAPGLGRHVAFITPTNVDSVGASTNSTSYQYDSDNQELSDPDDEETAVKPISLESSSAVAHLEYDDVLIVPPKPSKGNWTRFVCISHTFPVPDGDVLLHSGDLTGSGRVREFEMTMQWLFDLPHPIKM